MNRVLLTLVLCAAPLASAQPADSPVGLVNDPCPAPVPMPASVSRFLSDMFMTPRTLAPEDFAGLGDNPEFTDYIAAVNADTITDWPRLCRFRADNDDLLARNVKPRIVFMGDSITENWLLGDPAFFNDDHVNRGIGGQTTPQMLLRFRNDVVDLQPEFVHIMAGTNDVAGNTGPARVQDVKNNIMSMVELARANGIGVLLASIPPAEAFNWQPAVDPVADIRELNAWLSRYAADNALVYIDYFTPLAGPRGELRAALGNDGVHPNRDGYAIMRRVLETHLATP